MLKAVAHPNVVKYHGFIQKSGYMNIVLEYAFKYFFFGMTCLDYLSIHSDMLKMVRYCPR
jgi:hypothetical protein